MLNKKFVAYRLRKIASELDKESYLSEMNSFLQKDPEKFCELANKKLNTPYFTKFIKYDQRLEQYILAQQESARRGDTHSCQVFKQENPKVCLFVSDDYPNEFFFCISDLTDKSLQSNYLKGYVIDEWVNQPPTSADKGYFQHKETGNYFSEDSDELIDNYLPTIIEELSSKWNNK